MQLLVRELMGLPIRAVGAVAVLMVCYMVGLVVLA